MISSPWQCPGRKWTEYVLLFCCIPLLLYACTSGPASVKVETNVAQLFVDDYLIDSSQDLKRTLHQPLKDFGGNTPIISLDNEFGDFGATLEANGTIVFDPRLQKYVMIALGFSPEGRTVSQKPRWTFYRLYRFTSVDGLLWTKGDEGNPQWVFPGSDKDLYDPESGTSATNIDAFSYYYDDHDPEYKYKGWQHFANWKGDREGHYILKSKDGIFWERGPMVVQGYGGKEDRIYKEIKQNGRTLVGPGDVTLFYYDRLENRFLGIFKFYSPEPVENNNRLRSRAYAFFSRPFEKPFNIEELQRIQLIPPAAQVNNDMPYDEYYGSTGWRYESLWLGGLKIWHGSGDYSWSAAGCAYLKLISSRNGLDWNKVQFVNEKGVPEVFIANGEEGGNNGQNDGGYMTEFSQGPLKIGNELIYYYGSSSYGKNHPNNIRISGGGIFRARLRIDGFVSVDGGQLTTKPLEFSGNDLYVNAKGPVSIEVMGPEEDIIGSQTVRGDNIQHHILFEGNTLGSIRSGACVRLRFYLQAKAELYSFTIKS